MTRFRNANADAWNYQTADTSRAWLEPIEQMSVSPRDFARADRDPGQSEADIRLSLANGEYVLFSRAGRFDYQTGTRTLVPVEQGFASGYRLFFAYEADDLHPAAIRDSFGRELRLTWTDITGTGAFAEREPRGKAISAIGLPDGTRLEYRYGLAAIYNGTGWQNRLEQVRRVSTAGEALWGRTYRYEDTVDPLAVTGIDDKAGNRLSTVAYNAAGRVTSTERAGGVNRWSVRYFTDLDNPAHDVRRVTNPLGREETYTFAKPQGYAQGPGRAPRKLLEVRGQPAGEPGTPGFVPADSQTFVYQETWAKPSLLKGATDPNGNTSAAGLDVANMRPSETTNAAGETTRIFWTPGLDLPAHVIHPSGLHSFFEYSPEGRLLATTQAAGSSDGNPYGAARTTSYDWSPEGRLLAVNGPRDPADYGGQDDITSFTYDKSGNRLTMTNALGHVTRYGAYDANGNPGEMVDANGIRTLFTYDPLGRLASSTVKHPADPTQDAVTTYEHNSEGRLIALTQPETARLVFDYDLADRLTAMRAEDGERIDYTYDAASNTTSETVRRADLTRVRGIERTFDALSRLVSETLGPGRTTRWSYDRNGNPTRITSARGHATTNAFDALDRVVAVTAPAAGQLRTGYGAGGEVASVRDGIGVVTRYTRNVFGDVTREVSPDRGTTIYRYDDAGDLLSVTDGRGETVRYKHDVLGRAVRKTPADIAQSVFYGWDEPGTETTWRIGRLTRIRDASGTMTYNYDHRGNLVTQRQSLAGGGDPLFLRYAYDLADRVIRMTYPSGRQVAYRRDNKGRVLSVQTRPSNTDEWTVLASGMRYEPFGPLTAAAYGNGLRLANNWGDDGRLVVRRLFKGSGSDLSRLAYEYDPDDNITRIRDLVDPAGTQGYAYDAAGRVDRLETGAGAVRRVDYRYDANGNRLAQESRALPEDADPVATDAYSYVPGTNRLSEIAGPTGTRTITYDGRGNTAGELRPNGIAVISRYDAFGRLTGYQRSDTVLGFTYNGRDDRIAMVQDNLKRLFVYDPDGRVIGEYGPSGAADLKAEFIWTLPTTGEAGSFGGDDGLGGYQPLATVGIGAATGTPELAWTHGNHLGVPLLYTDAQGSSIAAEPRYLAPGFPGQSRVLPDLYHNRHRDYDPTTGRYIQADPIGLEGDANPYLYALGNPVGAVDPLGLSAVGVVGRIAALDLVTPDPSDAAVLSKLTGYALALAGAACVDYLTSDEDNDDRCAQLYAQITETRNELAKRLNEYRVDKYKLPDFGPNSRNGHVVQFRGWQKRLTKLLSQADSRNCKNYESDAWHLATMQIDRRF